MFQGPPGPEVPYPSWYYLRIAKPSFAPVAGGLSFTGQLGLVYLGFKCGEGGAMGRKDPNKP